jgi:hypothetical protein
VGGKAVAQDVDAASFEDARTGPGLIEHEQVIQCLCCRRDERTFNTEGQFG